MPLPLLALLPAAIGLASKYAPQLLGKLFGDKTGETAKKVIDMGAAAVGISPLDVSPEYIINTLKSNSEYQLKFHTAANALLIELYAEDTKRLESVNETMRFESRSVSLAQRLWRPFNGFLFGITIWCDYFLAPIALTIAKSDVTLTHVPMEIYLLWSSVLGVTAWSRGKEKLANINSGNVV